MSENNTTTNINCDNIIDDNPIEVYIFLVLIPDIVSSFFNLVLTYIIYHTVEIDHPQFALIFQNHCFGNVINFITNTLHIFNSFVRPIPCFTSIYTVLNYNALQFHFISWLAIAIMRMYFITHAENEQISFLTMKKYAFAFTWMFFLAIKVCLHTVYQLSSQDNVIRIVLYFATISPVIVCIFIYIDLKSKLKHKEELENLQQINRMEENPPENSIENELEQVSHPSKGRYSKFFSKLHFFFISERTRKNQG